tara:strand:+ start:968 stop:1168 length:201 start_codon:yes stop_codon:yes gene_type:complete
MDAEDIILELQAQIDDLREENESLWQMLEELKQSEIKNFQEALQAAHDRIELDRMLLRLPTDETIN